MKKYRWKKIVCTLSAMTILQTTVTASNIGLSTHMSHTHTNNTITGTMRLVEEIESEWIRDELRWGWGMEAKTKGELRMPTADWTDQVNKAGVNSLAILGFGNTLYNDINGVNDSSGIYVPTIDNEKYFEAFLNYVTFVVTNCKGKVEAYEIWNEPNHADFNYQISKSKYSYDPADYFELLKASYKVIKNIDPQAKVVGGAFLFGGTRNSGWIEELFASGAGAYMDAFSVHMYSYKDANPVEEEFKKDYARIEAAMDRYNFNGEVWLTETGYFTGSAQYSVSETDQAALLLRSKVAWDKCLMENERNGEFFAYTLRDSGEDEAKAGNNFGIVDFGYKKKTAFNAVKLFNSIMHDKELANVRESNDSVVAQYTNEASGDKVSKAYVAYNKNGEAQQDIVLDGHISYIYDMEGNQIDTVKGNNTYKAKLNMSPIIIESMDLETKINTLEYIKNKNLCKIEGTAKELDSVTVEFLDENGAVLQTEKAVVDASGNFSEIFSVNKNGKYTVRVGKPDLADFGSEYYAQQTIEMIADAELKNEMSINYTTALTKNTLNVKLTGESQLCEGATVNVMVIPDGNEKVDIAEVAYIGDTQIKADGAFELDFDIASADEHIYNYKLLIRAEKTDLSENALNHYLEEEDIITYNFTLTPDSQNINAAASVRNGADKEQNVTILISQYDADGRLIEVKTKNVKLAKTQDKQGVEFEAQKNDKAHTCKSFIYSNLSDIKPIAPSIAIK